MSTAWVQAEVSQKLLFLLVLNEGNRWVAGGCWDDDITSDEMDDYPLVN